MHTSGKCNNDHLNYFFISKIEKNTKTSAQPHVEAHKSLYFTTAPTHTSIENCNTIMFIQAVQNHRPAITTL